MKSDFAQKALAFLISPLFVGLTVTASVAGIAHAFYANYGQRSNGRITGLGLELLQQAHERSIDFRLKDRGPQLGSPDVAILTVDERAIEQEGRWPWPREKIAKAVEAALGFGAKQISFDVVFSEPDSNSTSPALERVAKRLREGGISESTAHRALDDERSLADSDGAFARMVRRHSDKLVMGSYFDAYRLNRRGAHVDACLSALFASSIDANYWAKEKIRLLIADPAKFNFPGPMLTHLKEYFGALQADGAEAWLAKHPSKKTEILHAFSDFGAPVQAEDAAAALQLFATQGMDRLLEALKPSVPSLRSPESSAKFAHSFGNILSSRDQSSVSQALQDSAELYCQRIFGPDDEMQSLEAFTKRNGAGASGWAAISWKAAWDEARAKMPSVMPNFEYDAWLHSALAASPDNMIEPAGRFWMDIQAIATATAHSGFFNAKQDSDGSIRRSMLVAHYGDEYFPSLALKAYLQASGHNAELELETTKSTSFAGALEKAATRLTIRNGIGAKVMDVPLDAQGRLAINYAGASQMFAHISVADMLSDDKTMKVEQAIYNAALRSWERRAVEVDKKAFLKDKLLIFGATATGIYDLRVTPFDENFPGVETHANVLSNFLIGEASARGETPAAGSVKVGFMHSDSREPAFMILGILIIGAAFSVLLAWLGSLAGLGIAVTAMALVYVIDKYFLFKSGLIVAIIFPVMTIVGVFVALVFYKYFVEERTRRELKGTFEKYVSPAIVAEILAHPSNVELGGKKMDLTVMFSDVRGFTTISEKLDPRALADLLNSYLTPMTGLVFAHKGTLDKYMGDAIMAFWGAPIHFPDHAKHASRCALAMIEKLRELQAEYRAKGLPEIDIGIGLNSGEMSVGNMGSDTIRSYTVMGDAVNLGSRLEGINKQYGTRIIVSEFTQQAIAADFATREVDWVRVKGKAQPVRIYELIAEKTASWTGSVSLRFFNEGLTLYHAKKFDAALALFRESSSADPNDDCARLYVERCENYLVHSPPPGWDGVFDMTTK